MMAKTGRMWQGLTTMRQETSNDEPARRHLLGMLAANSRLFSPVGAVLKADQWSQLQHMARQHRLEPLLCDAACSKPDSWAIPLAIQRDWAAAFRDSAMQALALQGTLIRLDGILSGAGIAYAALKGARLAWHAYRHPALRPMRDLDILVSPERMRETWDRLVDHGFSAGPGYALPADGGLAVHKHLPALRDPASEVHVEVHSRLFEHLDAAHIGAAMSNADGLLADRVWLALGPTKIAYLPATEALLHLIVHSAYEHHFENGPQVLHDLAAQMECEVIDWPRFWRLAREGGWERGCHLLLQLTEEFLGEQPIDWGPDSRAAIPRQVLDKSALLMLQDPDLRQDLSVQVQLAAQAGSAWAKAWRLLARLFVRSEVVAAYAGLAPDHPRIWLHYPRWLVSRLARTLAGKLNRHQQAEVSRASAVEAWLGGN